MKKKKKPKLPELNNKIIRYHKEMEEALRKKDFKKYQELVYALNSMLPPEYRLELESWFKHASDSIERQIEKYRSDYWAKK